jgi:tetratricopeptide (TPR) repeat protein
MAKLATAVLAVLGLFTSRPAQAQVPVADSAWTAGDFHTARIAYERELHDNPGSVRALYRLAVLASWAGRLDSALALLRDARELEPDDADVRFYQAKVLSWDGRFGPAVALYDSLLAEQPGWRDAAFGRAQTLAWANRFTEADAGFAALAAADPDDVDALAGRAMVAAWRGDLVTAVQRYEAALARKPDHVTSLVGLAQVRLWQGRAAEARHHAELALAASPEDRPAREVLQQVRALVRPRIEVTLGWSRDSDENTLWWQQASTGMAIGPGLRGFASISAAEASDPLRDGHRFGAEAGASYSVANLTLTGALGARRLLPDGAPSRSLATGRVSAGYRVAPGAGLGIGYAHYSFDETALLLSRRLDVHEVSVEGDVALSPVLSAGGGASLAWLSDDNLRRAAVASLTRRFAQRYTLGLFGRVLGYESPGAGYFTPDRFLVGELRGSWTWAVRKWESRLSAGLGLQQVGSDARAQSQWHAEARLARRFGTINEVALGAGISNSAVSSTTGAFRYYSAQLSARLGL